MAHRTAKARDRAEAGGRGECAREWACKNVPQLLTCRRVERCSGRGFAVAAALCGRGKVLASHTPPPKGKAGGRAPPESRGCLGTLDWTSSIVSLFFRIVTTDYALSSSARDSTPRVVNHLGSADRLTRCSAPGNAQVNESESPALFRKMIQLVSATSCPVMSTLSYLARGPAGRVAGGAESGFTAGFAAGAAFGFASELTAVRGRVAAPVDDCPARRRDASACPGLAISLLVAGEITGFKVVCCLAGATAAWPVVDVGFGLVVVFLPHPTRATVSTIAPTNKVFAISSLLNWLTPSIRRQVTRGPPPCGKKHAARLLAQRVGRRPTICSLWLALKAGPPRLLSDRRFKWKNGTRKPASFPHPTRRYVWRSRNRGEPATAVRHGPSSKCPPRTATKRVMQSSCRIHGRRGNSTINREHRLFHRTTWAAAICRQ